MLHSLLVTLSIGDQAVELIERLHRNHAVLASELTLVVFAVGFGGIAIILQLGG